MTTDTLRTLFAPLVFVSALGGCAATTQDGGETQSEPSAIQTSESTDESLDDRPDPSEMTADERAEEAELESDPSSPEPAEDPVDDFPAMTPGHGAASMPPDAQDDPQADAQAVGPLDPSAAPEQAVASQEAQPADEGTLPSQEASQEALEAQPAPEGAEDIGSTQQALSTSYGTTFKLTYYVIALRPKGDPDTYVLRDCNGKFLTYASRAFRADAIMQGTARYRDKYGNSQTINLGAGGCWVKLPYSQRWGLGAWDSATQSSYKLKPFRSIAVDRSVMKLGKWYYIKQLDGVRMPYPVSTMIHDGCVRAVDHGPAVNSRHIDFFSAYLSAYKKLIGGSSTMGGRESVTIYDGAVKCKRHM